MSPESALGSRVIFHGAVAAVLAYSKIESACEHVAAATVHPFGGGSGYVLPRTTNHCLNMSSPLWKKRTDANAGESR